MTEDDIVKEVREDFLDDAIEPYLWSTAWLKRYVSEAIYEACMRAPLITRVKTNAITAAVTDYAIDSSIRQITVAKLDLATSPLDQVTEATLAFTKGSAWRQHTGTPTNYIRTGHKLRLYPIPLVDDTLVMSTTNIPDDNFYLDDDIDPAYHKALMFYVVYKAYMLNDADTYNPIKAADFLAMFNNVFGDRNTAKYDAVAQSTPMYATQVGGRFC